MQKKLLIIGGLSCALAVILGALGAHYLQGKLDAGVLTANNVKSFETGVRYHFYHSLGLILLALLHEKFSKENIKAISYLFIGGIILFSGSIYFLSTKNISGLTNISWLGPITPLGGLSFISGWIFFSIAAFKIKS